jgi:hypothetical protein
VSVQARERLPQPYAITAAVSNDVLSRTLVVRLPETEVGVLGCCGAKRSRHIQGLRRAGGPAGRRPCGLLRWVLIGLPARCLVISKR